jgi:DNA-binding transcriptional MerR regulator
MEYRVEELAAETGLRVDTLRFYQARGLLPAPERVGRVAVYRDRHRERLQQIVDLKQQGFKLDQIQQVFERDETEGNGRGLLAALARHSVGSRSLSREELIAEAKVPDALIRAAESQGLIAPVEVDGIERFSEADLEMARAGQSILALGFPLSEILEQAIGHARNIEDTCDHAIDLFDTHIRKAGPNADDDHAIAEAFQLLLPQVTRLVALHFQRTLVARAMRRLDNNEEASALRAAVAATRTHNLEVDVAWR